MKNLLAVIGDGNAGPVLEAALMAARRFNSHIVGLHSLTTEYAVVFGGEMGFSISSEVDRTLEREGHERRDQARNLFRDFMNAQGVPIGPPSPGYNGPSASWREGSLWPWSERRSTTGTAVPSGTCGCRSPTGATSAVSTACRRTACRGSNAASC